VLDDAHWADHGGDPSADRRAGQALAAGRPPPAGPRAVRRRPRTSAPSSYGAPYELGGTVRGRRRRCVRRGAISGLGGATLWSAGPMGRVGFHASHEQISPRQLLADVQHAERAGFHMAMCSDHLAPWTTAQGHSGYAWSWLAAALATTDLELGCVSAPRSEEHTSELQSRENLVCRLLLDKKI